MNGNRDRELTITAQDITDDRERLKLTLTLASQGYARLSSGHVSKEEAFAELWHDAYYRHNLARIFLATGSYPGTRQVPISLGTVRLVLGSPATRGLGLQPLEAMELVTPPGGWHTFDFAGFRPERSAEFSRLAIFPMRGGRKPETAKQGRLIARALFEEAVRVARQQYEKEQFWAIMPDYVVRFVRSAGIRTIRAPQVKLNHAKHAPLFKKYDKYWIRSEPKFYKFVT